LQYSILGWPKSFFRHHETVNLTDIAANGLDALERDDPRDPRLVAADVAALIAQGEPITEACAASIVAPHIYVGWTITDSVIGEMHSRAVECRAKLLADTPLTLAREVRAARAPGAVVAAGGSLREVVGAIEAEARLVAAALATGSAGAAPQMVRVSFDSPSPHLLAATSAADSAAVASAAHAAQLSDGDGESYTMVERDELDG
jgi:hypothetical protein